MLRPNRVLLPAALAFALAVSLSLYGQAPQPAPAAKDDPKDPPVGGVVKGEVKPGLHTVKLNASNMYVIKVRAKHFQPMTQIKDKSLTTTHMTYNTATPFFINGQQEWLQQFTFTPPATGEFCVILSQNFVSNVNAPMEYVVEVKTVKTILAVQDKLTTSEPFYSLRGNCFYKVHTVKLEAGTSYQIDMQGTYSPYLLLEDALGNVMQQNSNGGGFNHPRIIFTPTKTDTYRVIASSAGYNATGNYTLTVSNSPSAVGFGPGGVGIGIGGPFNPPPFPNPPVPVFPNPIPKPIPKPFPKQPNGGLVPNPGGALQPLPLQPLPLQPLPLPGLQIQPAPGALQPGGIQFQPIPPNGLPPGGIQIQPVPPGALQPGLIQPAPFPGPAIQPLPAPAPAPANPVPGTGQKDAKKSEDDFVFSGELKFNVHPFKLTAGQVYMVNVRTKNFQPHVTVRNAQTNQVLMTKTGGNVNPNGQGYVMAFSYEPTSNETFNVNIINYGTLNQPGPLEYIIEVKQPFFAKKDQLLPTDAFYAKRPNCRHKEYTVALKANVTYQIDLVGNIAPFLYLENAAGAVLQTNYNGGGINNARIIFTPAQAADHKIIVTTLGNFVTGPFTLTVNEMVAPGAFPGPGPLPPMPVPPFPVPAPK